MKYELTNETKIVYGITLYRIKATKDFGIVSQGTLGGFVEKIENLSMYGNAWVYGDAKVYGDAWEKSPLFIAGSRHSLTNCKHGFINIGCKEFTFEYWKQHFKTIGKIEGYTPEEIEEYGLYIDLFCKIGK